MARTKINWNHIYVYVCTAILLLGLGLVCFWRFWPYDVISFNAPYVTTKTIYHPGDVLEVSVDITQKVDGVHVTVVRQLQNDIIINFSDTTYVAKKGRLVFKNNSLVIPTFAPKGKYHLATVSIYHINPIRDVTITRITNEFEIK